MRNATKSIPNVQPHHTEFLFVATSLANKGLQDVTMFIPALSWPGTFFSNDRIPASIAQHVILCDKMPINSLYTQDMRAIGRKLLISAESPFLEIRTVTASFQTAGTFCARRQVLNIKVRILPDRSTRLRHPEQYSQPSEASLQPPLQ